MPPKAKSINDINFDKLAKSAKLNQNPNPKLDDIFIKSQKGINDLNNDSDDYYKDSEEKERTVYKTTVYQIMNKNKNYFEFFNKKMKESQYNLMEYIDKHVMYLLLTDIEIEGVNQYYFIIKIGYSNNIANRLKELKTKFGITCYPICIKEIPAISTEKKFHAYMATYKPLYDYKENKFPKKVTQQKTREFYYGTEELYNFFVSYVDNIICDYKYKMEIEKTKQDIEKTKQDIEKTKQKEIDERIDIEKTKQKQIEKDTKQIEKDTKQIEKDTKKMEITKLFIEKNLSLDDMIKYT
jgi:hypothetical protein